MYKHARSWPKASQERDIYEDREFLGKNLVAAGIDPPGSENFYQRAIFELMAWPKKRPSASIVAQKLNSRGVPNAVGGQWTPTIIKMFIETNFPMRQLPL
jgi:hypothetical protein